MTRTSRYPSSIPCAALAVLATLGMLSSAAPIRGQNRPVADAPTVKTINVDHGLHRLGKKTGYHFTLEIVNGTRNSWRTPEIPEPAIDELLAQSFTDLSPQQFAAQLNERFPDYRFVVNKKKTSIVHVIEKKLDKIEPYPLEQKVTLDFEGTPQDMVRALHEKLPSVDNRKSGSFRQMFGDYFSEVAIRAKEQKVRDILTDASEWKYYNHIIWRAETAADTKTTIVAYYGPLRPF